MLFESLGVQLGASCAVAKPRRDSGTGRALSNSRDRLGMAALRGAITRDGHWLVARVASSRRSTAAWNPPPTGLRPFYRHVPTRIFILWERMITTAKAAILTSSH